MLPYVAVAAADGLPLLTRAGAALSAAIGPDDTAARLGGDEFALILPVGGRSLHIRASSGIAGGTADTTMYAAKRVPGSACLHHEYDSAVAA